MKNNLRVIRAEKRITQFQLRLMTGIHQSKLSMAENDLIELRPAEKAKLAKALGVGVKDIWTSEPNKPRVEAPPITETVV
jgi:transcriptional regulator with XRE-family HTH domain